MKYQSTRIVSLSQLVLQTVLQHHTLLINLLLLLAPAVRVGAQSGSLVQTLEMEKPLTRELAGGQRHSYQLTLEAGQYIQVVVEQRGINLGVILFSPDNQQIAEFDSEPGTEGKETIVQVAETTGTYRLDVQARQQNAPAGRYEIRLVERRAATEQERTLHQARRLNNEFFVLHRAGKYDEARPLAEQVVKLLEAGLGPAHSEVARALGNLANLYSDQGDYDKAESLFQRAVAINEKAFGPEHPALAVTLYNLANLYYEQGNYDKAEPLHRRVLALREKAFGPDHLDVALSLSALGILCYNLGDYARAVSLHQRALAIKEKALGPEHPSVAYSLNGLASSYSEQGNYAKAKPLYERALVIKEKKLGPAHPSVASSLHNLAHVYYLEGDYARAEPLHRRALAIKEKALGPAHPSVANSLDSLASLYYAAGDYARAEPLYQRALTIWEQAQGPTHPDVVMPLNHLAMLYEARGDLGPAVALQSRANEVSERNFVLNLAIFSERQKLAYLATLTDETDHTISLHLRSAPNHAAARRLALTTILQRKGRALDATADSLGALRRRFNTQDQTLLEQFKDTSAQLAKLVLAGPQRIPLAEHQRQIEALEEQKERLEAEISRCSTEFRAQSQQVTIEAVQAALPVNAALIEFFSYRPFNAKYAKPGEQFGSPRYVAYVLRREGESQWVDLGETAAIDRAVEAWRKVLRDPRRTDVKQLAQSLEEKVMRPVRALLGETRRVLISPDGALNLIPFAALVDEQGRYLVERYSFSYLTSGRDLLRWQSRLPGKPEPVIVADPVFGELADLALAQRRDVVLRPEPQSSVNQGMNLDRIYFPQLPATAGEAQMLKSILPQATVITREQATEAALKRLSSPRILHIATHGFFLADGKTRLDDTRDVVWQGGGAGLGSTPLENPLLRSGLALAGANLRKSGEDDGVLTALEVAGLDLWGTKLVVLSACDTGVGEVKNGEGVYGLRRALVLAGSETQVMSLWPVSDAATRDLMIDYYKALQLGQGRGEGLRQVQLVMLKNKKRQHPFYWASFIQSGEWANLEGRR